MKIHYFNRVAEDYAFKVSPYRYSQFLSLIHELQFEGFENVLDIGCGPGPLSLEGAAKLPMGNLLGIDLSQKMIELARQLAIRRGISNAEFQTGDAMSLDLESNRFDIVFSSNAFPWVADQGRFLRETYRVLKPGGRLGLVSLSTNIYREFLSALRQIARRNKDLLPHGANTRKAMNFKRYSVDILRKEVAEAGFIVQRAFQLSTEEPISPRNYLDRVNAIVGENYLDGLNDSEKKKIRSELYHAMAHQNGDLKITESSVILIAVKQ